MKERPILMSASMVRALLASTKTQTRRACKLDVRAGMSDPEWKSLLGCCPYGQPGDHLNVRETFFAWGRWETRFSAKKGRDEWHFVDMTLEAGKSYAYAADGLPAGYGKHHGGRGGITPAWWKRPAIFMPRAASRITLEVTDVRAERLQDISEADALAEGIVPAGDGNGYQLADTTHYSGNPIDSYFSLWEAINGPGNVEANPWVWCVSFKRVEA